VIDIRGKSALVTGANQGLGHAFAEALLEAGAGRIYAGARDPSTVKDPRFTPVRLDVTKAQDVAAAAAACGGVQIIINNAGAMLATPVLAESSEDALRRETEVNVFGMRAMKSPELVKDNQSDPPYRIVRTRHKRAGDAYE
jgi:NAD(P)-dependent dehydrogenase (short-subunit alcohol dehydrogenase family)